MRWGACLSVLYGGLQRRSERVTAQVLNDPWCRAERSNFAEIGRKPAPAGFQAALALAGPAPLAQVDCHGPGGAVYSPRTQSQCLGGARDSAAPLRGETRATRYGACSSDINFKTYFTRRRFRIFDFF